MNLSTVKWTQWDKTQSRELLGLFICVCIALCTIVAYNTAQNRPDNFPSYPLDNHRWSDDVYLRKKGAGFRSFYNSTRESSGSQHWPQHSKLTQWPHSVLIYHRTPNGTGALNSLHEQQTTWLRKPGTVRVQALTDISRSALCRHSNETSAPTANPPNSAQLEGTSYHSPSYTSVQ